MEAQVLCPYCGEEASVWIDDSAGDFQRYVEDCPICCRPWQLSIWRDDDGELRATALHQDA
jgi:hypothetical protein